MYLSGIPRPQAGAVTSFVCHSWSFMLQAEQLWHVLHDLVLLHLTGAVAPAEQPRRALAQLWAEVHADQADDAFPVAGQAFVLQYLLAWGCPLALVEALQACPTSSRRVLLALGWLVARARVLERSLDACSLQPALRAMLPPYPQARRGEAALPCLCTPACQAGALGHARRLSMASPSLRGRWQ